MSVQSLSAEIRRHLELSGTYHEINAHAVSRRLGKFTKYRKNGSLRVAYHDILTQKTKKMGFTTLLIQRCGRCLLHRQVRFLFSSDHVFIYSDTLRLFMCMVNLNLAGVMQCCFVVYGV